MTAQIIEFPMDRVRPAKPMVRTRRHQAAISHQVRPSVRIARIILFWILVISTVATLSMMGSSNLSPAQANDVNVSSGSTNFAYITVRSGDTLWGIAQRYAPNQDPRDFITKLVALNNLESSSLAAGMQLALPIQ
ncbi:MAG: LysM peptidoglycan-binding domain-containing protein [Microbacteriaceae bacterium]|nr:LysM peptidoglycan-binding domain-containing protein [Microbacteriaceae bacterium]